MTHLGPAPERIVVDYRLHAGPRDGAVLARQIAYEQTVELPESLVTDAHVNDAVVGRVEALQPDPSSAAHVHARISYSGDLASGHLLQLLNLVYGNVSIYPEVRLSGLTLPDSVLDQFAGPHFGVQGLRALLGVYERPLLATALKPRGLPVSALAAMAGQFALGGGDIVKDDQNLVDDFEAFKVRVEACKGAVDDANSRTGRRCVYFPHVSAPYGQVERYFDFVAAMELPGVLVCPMVMGLDTARALAGQYPLLMMAHPALTGSYMVGGNNGIAHEVLLGTLFRLAGADISIFPNYGGRFSFPRSACQAIRKALAAPLGSIAPAWACPAGGMQHRDLPAMCADYGPDSVFLIGGALLGHAPSLEHATAAFLASIEETYPERRRPPVTRPYPDRALEDLARHHLPFVEGFSWEGRSSAPYKDSPDLAFKGVRRVELVGKFGERTKYDLRYFEVQPGGFSSHEKHVHTHIIIGARGQGQLRLGNRQVTVDPLDVAYVGPLEAHQLRNESNEPFGFFCIVDHERDRPRPAARG